MDARVFVVGAINTDLVIQASHLPAPGETVIGGNLQTFGGGKAANAAVAAARLGANVTLIGAVGNDVNGRAALEDLTEDGVDVGGVAVLDDVATGAALIVVDGNGENQIAIGPGANGAVDAALVEGRLDGQLTREDIVVVSPEIPLEAVVAAVTRARACGARCILNPAPAIAGIHAVLEHAPLLTPNEHELDELCRQLRDESQDRSIEAQLATLQRRSGSPAIVTLGAAGCALCDTDGRFVRLEAPLAPQVVDTTGAGDTFNGALACRLAAGDALDVALEIALVAASLSVTEAGARSGMPRAEAVAAARMR